MSKKGYERLERTIEREYRRKGYSTKRASYIAHAAAGKVARERRARRMRRNPSGGTLLGLALLGLGVYAAMKAAPALTHPAPGRAGGVVGNVGY